MIYSWFYGHTLNPLRFNRWIFDLDRLLDYAHNFDSALHAHLQPKSIAAYLPTLMYSARQHIYDILEEPNGHQDHAKRCVLFPLSHCHWLMSIML